MGGLTYRSFEQRVAQVRTGIPPCAWCGAELDIEWVDVSWCGDPQSYFIPGRVTCPTPGCGPRCPTCRREPGDIHGPDCGEIIAGKLGDLAPCTITKADCGERMTSERSAA